VLWCDVTVSEIHAIPIFALKMETTCIALPGATIQKTWTWNFSALKTPNLTSCRRVSVKRATVSVAVSPLWPLLCITLIELHIKNLITWQTMRMYSTWNVWCHFRSRSCQLSPYALHYATYLRPYFILFIPTYSLLFFFMSFTRHSSDRRRFLIVGGPGSVPG
jgi:hypothetical protein